MLEVLKDLLREISEVFFSTSYFFVLRAGAVRMREGRRTAIRLYGRETATALILFVVFYGGREDVVYITSQHDIRSEKVFCQFKVRGFVLVAF